MNELLYRLGTSSTNLATGHFYVRGLPMPRQAIYNDHSGRRPTGVGGESRHGYLNAQFLWDRLSVAQANILRELIDTAETTGGQGNGTLWATLPKTTAEASGIAWIDISGIAIMPQWIPTEQAHGVIYENVVLRINDCTVENEPSTIFVPETYAIGQREIVSIAESVTVTLV